MFWAELWKISEFLSENFLFLEVKFSVYLNRCVFVMPPVVLKVICQQHLSKYGNWLIVDHAVFTILKSWLIQRYVNWRPICPYSTDPGHVVHTMQHNQGLQRSDCRINYITTCIYFTSQTSSEQRGPRSDALSRSARSTLPAKAGLSKQVLHCSEYRIKHITICKHFTS